MGKLETNMMETNNFSGTGLVVLTQKLFMKVIKRLLILLIVREECGEKEHIFLRLVNIQ
jgi:hypothetical protein